MLKQKIIKRYDKYSKKNRLFKNTFNRDLMAMKQVWNLLKEGAIRWIGEVGRKY